MASVTKKEVVQAINDINDLLGFDTPIQATEDMSVAALTAAIAEKQEGEDAFVADDFRPGKKNSLTIDTVKILKRLKIKIPAVWEKRLGGESEEGDVPNPAIEAEKKAVKSESAAKKTVEPKKVIKEEVTKKTVKPEVEKSPEEKPLKKVAKSEEKKSGKVSLYDAAMIVLRESGKPMKIKDIFQEVTDRDLWSSETAKTPLNSLSARFTTTIAKGNKEVIKTAPGTFQIGE